MVHVPVSASIRNPHPFQAIALPGAPPYLAVGLLREYDSEDMKVKTSVTLSEALLKAISAESNIENRSDFIESALWMYLERLRLRERDRLEIERIDANAAFLNAEGGEAGEFQNE